MGTELKPCPFCGEAKDLRLVTDTDYPEIECLNCFAVSPFLGDGGWDWNTRPAEDALKAEVERLKGALLQIEYFRDLNPDLYATDYVVDIESELKNFYCKMGDIAKAALADSDEPEKGGDDENSIDG